MSLTFVKQSNDFFKEFILKQESLMKYHKCFYSITYEIKKILNKNFIKKRKIKYLLKNYLSSALKRDLKLNFFDKIDDFQIKKCNRIEFLTKEDDNYKNSFRSDIGLSKLNVKYRKSISKKASKNNKTANILNICNKKMLTIPKKTQSPTILLKKDQEVFDNLLFHISVKEIKLSESALNPATKNDKERIFNNFNSECKEQIKISGILSTHPTIEESKPSKKNKTVLRKQVSTWESLSKSQSSTNPIKNGEVSISNHQHSTTLLQGIGDNELLGAGNLKLFEDEHFCTDFDQNTSKINHSTNQSCKDVSIPENLSVIYLNDRIIRKRSKSISKLPRSRSSSSSKISNVSKIRRSEDRTFFSSPQSRNSSSCSLQSLASISLSTSELVSSHSSRSRSPSIPRRYGSPSFLDRRRITSARKRPVPYHRPSPSPVSSTSSKRSSNSSSRSEQSYPSSQHLSDDSII